MHATREGSADIVHRLEIAQNRHASFVYLALEEAQRGHEGRLGVLGSKPVVDKVFEILQLQTVMPLFSRREEALRFVKA